MFCIDCIKTLHACAKNYFLLTALLLEPLSIIFTGVDSIENKENWQKSYQKRWSYAIKCPGIRTVVDIKIGAAEKDRKLCLLLLDLNCFLVSLILS